MEATGDGWPMPSPAAETFPNEQLARVVFPYVPLPDPPVLQKLPWAALWDTSKGQLAI